MLIKGALGDVYITCQLSGRCFTTLHDLSKWVFLVSCFCGWNIMTLVKAIFVSEIRWQLRIFDAETSSNFWHKLDCRSVAMDTSSTNLQTHENAFVELTRCSETHPWILMSSNDCLSPVWQQAISWTSADLLPVGPMGTNFSEMWI